MRPFYLDVDKLVHTQAKDNIDVLIRLQVLNNIRVIVSNNVDGSIGWEIHKQAREDVRWL